MEEADTQLSHIENTAIQRLPCTKQFVVLHTLKTAEQCGIQMKQPMAARHWWIASIRIGSASAQSGGIWIAVIAMYI
ncbi:hypothetical protein ACHMW6_25290 [Pseudoduganella sp. UC29_106]|uniref:hypothetical protein n=1 Tax=Pseudoduganella sp. UC29_106 TaxID=3374553 RepID=UPI00375776B9